MSRKSRNRKRARKAGRRPRPARATAAYRQAVRQADQVVVENEVDLQPETWPQIVMDWFAPEEPERGTLARVLGESVDA
jgi:hypothetical protein